MATLFLKLIVISCTLDSLLSRVSTTNDIRKGKLGGAGNRSLTIKLRDQTIELNEGEFFIIPSGVEHLPIAKEEVHILLFEPKTTIKTGD